jgi:hypothetical protein
MVISQSQPPELWCCPKGNGKISRINQHIFERQGKYAIRVFVLCVCVCVCVRVFVKFYRTTCQTVTLLNYIVEVPGSNLIRSTYCP